jgi:hypothetical protein
MMTSSDSWITLAKSAGPKFSEQALAHSIPKPDPSAGRKSRFQEPCGEVHLRFGAIDVAAANAVSELTRPLDRLTVNDDFSGGWNHIPAFERLMLKLQDCTRLLLLGLLATFFPATRLPAIIVL